MSRADRHIAWDTARRSPGDLALRIATMFASRISTCSTARYCFGFKGMASHHKEGRTLLRGSVARTWGNALSREFARRQAGSTASLNLRRSPVESARISRWKPVAAPRTVICDETTDYNVSDGRRRNRGLGTSAFVRRSRPGVLPSNLRRTRGVLRCAGGFHPRVAPFGRDSFQDLYDVVTRQPPADLDRRALAAKVIDYGPEGPDLSEFLRSNHVPKA